MLGMNTQLGKQAGWLWLLVGSVNFMISFLQLMCCKDKSSLTCSVFSGKYTLFKQLPRGVIKKLLSLLYTRPDSLFVLCCLLIQKAFKAESQVLDRLIQSSLL